MTINSRQSLLFMTHSRLKFEIKFREAETFFEKHFFREIAFLAVLKTFSQFKNGFLAIFEIEKKWNLVKKISGN